MQKIYEKFYIVNIIKIISLVILKNLNSKAFRTYKNIIKTLGRMPLTVIKVRKSIYIKTKKYFRLEYNRQQCSFS
jgi:hypothetical protein